MFLASYNIQIIDRHILLVLWKTMVLPILDYCSQLWNPHLKGEISILEEIQKSFTRKIAGINANYWERLVLLKLYSLQRRRERYIMIYVWKILEGLVPNMASPITTTNSPRHGRMCNVNVRRKHSRIATLINSSLSVHGCRLFNSLPKDISNVNINFLKNKLDQFLSSIPDEPQTIGYTLSRRANTNSILDMLSLRVAPAPR